MQSGLAVSLPAAEISAGILPGSVFDAGALVHLPISDNLRFAIRLVSDICLNQEIPIIIVARPEIFTHGDTLSWLRKRLGKIKDHLCISDGTSIKILPGMRNHVFLYALNLQSDAQAFQRLRRRAAELFSNMYSQVNTAFFIRQGSKCICPTPILIQPGDSQSFEDTKLLPFYINQNSITESVSHIVNSKPHTPNIASQFARILLVPLTETAIVDESFATIATQIVAQTYFEPSTCLILRAPFLKSAGATIADRIEAVLSRIRGANFKIPRNVANNVFFASNDLDHNFVQKCGKPIEFITHESYDFWRYSQYFYLGLAEVTVIASRANSNPPLLVELLTKAFGRKPKMHWIPQLTNGIS